MCRVADIACDAAGLAGLAEQLIPWSRALAGDLAGREAWQRWLTDLAPDWGRWQTHLSQGPTGLIWEGDSPIGGPLAWTALATLLGVGLRYDPWSSETWAAVRLSEGPPRPDQRPWREAYRFRTVKRPGQVGPARLYFAWPGIDGDDGSRSYVRLPEGQVFTRVLGDTRPEPAHFFGADDWSLPPRWPRWRPATAPHEVPIR